MLEPLYGALCGLEEHLAQRPRDEDGHFGVERYALAVYNEICMALYGLVEEE